MKKTILIVTFGLFINQSVQADTRISVETPNGLMTSWSNDKYLRAKISPSKSIPKQEQMPGDIFSDLRSKKTYMINDKEKVLINMETPFANAMANFPGMPKPPELKISFKNKSVGDKIAGLATTKYDVYAEGQKCFEVNLTKNSEFGSVIEKFNAFSDEQDEAQDICEKAENKLDANTKLGYPVKIIGANGKVKMLLKDFKTNMKAPRKYLALPKGYTVMSMMEYMQKAMKEGNFKIN